jgi:hypothetical protein
MSDVVVVGVETRHYAPDLGCWDARQDQAHVGAHTALDPAPMRRCVNKCTASRCKALTDRCWTLIASLRARSTSSLQLKLLVVARGGLG